MYNVPILKPDEVIRAGSWVVVSGVHCIVKRVEDEKVYLVTDWDGYIFTVPLGRLYDDATLPQAQYCIWRDDASKCTCGAKHTSFPNQHMSYCAV